MLDVNEHFSFQLTQPKRLDEHRGIKGKERIVTRRQGRERWGCAEHGKGSQHGTSWEVVRER